MKTCFSCKESKFEGLFSPSNYNKDGLKGNCRSCINKKERQKRADGIGGCKERSARYRAKNPIKRQLSLSKFRMNNPLMTRSYSLTYRNTCAGKLSRKRLHVERRQREKTQTLKGFKINRKNINILIKDLESKTGIKFCADHIIPLKGDNVSGLHVPWNIQIVPYIYNASKGNRL